MPQCTHGRHENGIAHASILIVELKMTKMPFSAAERMRLYRQRRRWGIRYVRIPLHVTEIDELVHNPDRAFEG